MAPQGELLLDKSMFTKRLPLLALRVPKQLCQRVTKILSGYVLNKPRIKHVIADPHDDGLRLVLLSEAVVDPDLKGVPQERLPALRELIRIEVVAHESVLDYSYWSAEEILKEILPPGCEVPSSFETIGHIAHLNLHEELLPYKKTIGEVILDKNQPRIRTVVNKVGTIKNEFRVPEFEILAGEDNFVTSVKQYGATFYLDYRLVYWNSRLEQEHKRLVSQFKRGQVICDMFAGIGPFAIPAALNGCIVYANDLNPASVKYLQLNSEKNKVGNQIFTYNMDAREFMHHITVATENAKIAFLDDNNDLQHLKGSVLNGHAEPRLLDADALGVKTVSNECQTVKAKEKVGDNDGSLKRVSHGREVARPLGSTPREHFDHVVMNLPASAITFLDVFRGLLSREAWKTAMPYIHCYHFMRSNETASDVVQEAERIIGSSLSGSSVWIVRDVAPNKVMVCLSFQLPESVAFGDQLESQISQEPVKRIRTS